MMMMMNQSSVQPFCKILFVPPWRRKSLTILLLLPLLVVSLAQQQWEQQQQQQRQQGEELDTSKTPTTTTLISEEVKEATKGPWNPNKTTTTTTTSSPLTCETHEDCNDYFLKTHKIPKGVSDCIDGMCSNPFAQGCLSVMMPPPSPEEDGDATTTAKRVCNSDDHGNNSRFCIPTTEKHPYDEIRILPGNWESSIFLGWMMQILLSEVLHVPVTMETSTPDGTLSFYDLENHPMTYPTVPYNFQALQTAHEAHGNCTKWVQHNQNTKMDDEDYVPCGHVMPEVWSGQIDAYNQAVRDGTIEPPEGNGMVGEFGFMIPQRLAQDDPSLMSWYGLQNRTKMASLFLPPWTWLDYCTLVSPNNCTISDDVAQRFPLGKEEQGMYFLNDMYTGYFAAKEANNCTLHPDDCVGHVVDPPCDWDTFTESQMYWNDIPLQSMGPLEPNHGYSYFNMLEIYHAANATKSPVFMWWWKPDSLDQLFFDTDYAMQPVYFPPATEHCELNRVTPEQRCSSNALDRVGLPVGSCGFPPHPLQKAISSALWEQTQQQPQAWQSPAHEFILNFRVSDLSISNLLKDWITMEPSVDPYGLDARMAVCSWVTENIDTLMEKFIPHDYPRIYQEQISTPIFIAALACGCVALMFSLFATVFTMRYRQSLVFRYAHVPFVLWVCCGLIMVSIGSILSSFQPTNALCIAQPYFVTVGYTIELMPLVVKVAVIGHLLREAKKFRKVVMKTKVLHIRVSSVVVCVLAYVIAWSIIDPLQVEETAVLVEQGEPQVNLSTSCASDAKGWVLAAYVWQGLLLLMALVMAIQNRKVKQEFNESQSLAFMVYSHTLFLVLRAMIYSLPPGNFPKSNAQAGYISLCLSLDSLNTLLVYFAPKIYVIWKSIASEPSSNFHHPAPCVPGVSCSLGSLRPLDGVDQPSSTFDNRFEAPAPNPMEMEELLDEALRSLSHAAETKARILSGWDGERGCAREGFVEDDGLEDRFFFSKPELIRFRTICVRLGWAQFDWEQHSMMLTNAPSCQSPIEASSRTSTSAWLAQLPPPPLSPGKRYSNNKKKTVQPFPPEKHSETSKL